MLTLKPRQKYTFGLYILTQFQFWPLLLNFTIFSPKKKKKKHFHFGSYPYLTNENSLRDKWGAPLAY